MARLPYSLTILFAALVGCGSRERAGGATPAAASSASRGDSMRMAQHAESVATARDEWNVAEVVRRLEEAGLVVTDSGRSARRAGVEPAGHVLTVSGGTLELYLYPSSQARARASAVLDTATHGLPSIQAPRWIFSGNLIAVLTTPRDLLAERVENVLLARHGGGT